MLEDMRLADKASTSFSGRQGPREAMQARKLEEARRREEELLAARKQYFGERQQAERKNREMYERSEGHGVAAAAHRLHRLESEHYALTRRIDNLKTEMLHADSGTGRSADGARMELEAEMERSAGPGPRDGQGSAAELLSTRHFVKGEMSERISALRQVCIASLGEALFRQVYNLMRAHLNGEFGNDNTAEFVRDVASLVGQNRMHHVKLVDQLLYFEDRL